MSYNWRSRSIDTLDISIGCDGMSVSAEDGKISIRLSTSFAGVCRVAEVFLDRVDAEALRDFMIAHTGTAK